MPKRPLSEYLLSELRDYCLRGKITYTHEMSKDELLDVIKTHNKAQWKERMAKAALSKPAPTPAPTPVQTPVQSDVQANGNGGDHPVITQESLDSLLREVVSLKQEVLSLKQGGPVHQPAPGENVDAKTLLKMFHDTIRGETNKAGTMRQEFVDPNDVLPQKVRFWSRGISFRMREIQIGPVPQALPYGMEKIEFHRVMGPFAVKNDEYPIPQIFVLCQFETNIKSLVELMRKDVRYGTRFTEDSTELLNKPVKNEWAMARERHLSQLNINHDPMYIFGQCKELGIPYTSGTDVSVLRKQVAEKLADNEVAGLAMRLEDARAARERELSLRREQAAVTA